MRIMAVMFLGSALHNYFIIFFDYYILLIFITNLDIGKSSFDPLVENRANVRAWQAH